jgi:hypothetical protein
VRKTITRLLADNQPDFIDGRKCVGRTIVATVPNHWLQRKHTAHWARNAYKVRKRAEGLCVCQLVTYHATGPHKTATTCHRGQENNQQTPTAATDGARGKKMSNHRHHGGTRNDRNVTSTAQDHGYTDNNRMNYWKKTEGAVTRCPTSTWTLPIASPRWL